MDECIGFAAVEGSAQFRQSVEALIRKRVRELIEQVLEQELDTAVRAGRSQRSGERAGYRHGHKPRRLALRSGVVQLQVPRGRLLEGEAGEREWHSALLPRYRRNSPEVEQAVLGVYLAGGNTRRIRIALQPLLQGAALSKSAVSRWWRVCRTTTSAGAVAIWAPKHAREAVRKDYHAIVYAPSRSEAEQAHRRFLSKWEKLAPSVAASLEEAGDELLTFFDFPPSQHKALRSTNSIERVQEEFRRRVKTQASLPNDRAVLLLFFALFASGQIKLRRLDGSWSLPQVAAAAA
jgi:transposase-like protein